jgi:hypothetical protein
MARQTGLFVGHVGEDCGYMMQEIELTKLIETGTLTASHPTTP